MESLQTGDLLLFSGTSWSSYFSEYFGCCTYHHVGLIIRNPRFMFPDLPDGIYVLDTKPIQDLYTSILSSIRIRPLLTVISSLPHGTVYYRRTTIDSIFQQKIHRIMYRISHTNLSIWEWLKKEGEESFIFPRAIKFEVENWCAVFLAYCCHQVGMIGPVNWCLVEPRDFSSIESFLPFSHPISEDTLIW